MLHGRLSGSGSVSLEADREDRAMFASIRTYNVRRGSAEHLARGCGRASCP